MSSSTYGWGTASTIINLFHSILSWANPQSSSDSKLATVITALVYGVGWDSNKNVYFPFDSTLKSKGLAGLISEAWGYNYSGTAIFYKNSPAAWLSNINTNVMGSFSRLGDISNGVGTQNNLLKAQWGYGFGGTVVVEEGSPFAKLKYIQESSLPHINDNLISAVRSLRQQWGYNYGTGDTIVYASNSPAGWLSNINTHVTGSFSRLGDISNGVGSQNNFLKEYVPSILDVLRSLDTNVTGSFSRLGDISNGVGSQNDLLRSFDSHLVSHSSLVSRGFFDVLAKLDNLNVSVGSVTVDNSGVESRLDDIRNLLLAAGVVENSKDIISALVGDFDMAKTSAAAARVEPFLSSLFPFCVPAIVKQVFGLLRHDPSTVLATVEVWGVPIDLDLTQFQLVADVSSWVARILFTVGLLVNSRKFVYTGGDSVC